MSYWICGRQVLIEDLKLQLAEKQICIIIHDTI